MKTNCPHIVVGTPGRILALVRDKTLNLKHIKHFILDECDKMLEQLGKSPPPSQPFPFLSLHSFSVINPTKLPVYHLTLFVRPSF